jgi:hypothetical protein
MPKSRRSQFFMVVFVALVAATVWILSAGSNPPLERPTASNYYHGAFRNQKDPNVWGDENGNRVPPPADAIPYVPDNPNRDTSRDMFSSPTAGVRAFNPALPAKTASSGKPANTGKHDQSH